MSGPFPEVALRQVVVPVARGVAPQPGTSYRQIGVRLWGEGAYEREPVDGGATQYATLYEARTGDIVVNKIWARNGSVAVVDERLSGGFGSGEFPMFAPTAALLPRWAHWLTKWRPFWERCAEKSQGTSGQNRIKPEQFLDIAIPLPPLPEQQRIVARVEEISASLAVALGLSERSSGESGALARASRDAVYARVAARHPIVNLGSLCTTLTDGDHNTPPFSDSGVPFIFVGNVSSARLHFDGAKRVTAEYFQGLRPPRIPTRGDVLFSAVGATLGIPAVVDTDANFCFQRHIAILKPLRDEVSPHFLWNMLMSQTCFDAAWKSTTGSAQPTIPLHAIRALPIPKAPLVEQLRVVAELEELQVEVDSLERGQAQVRSELDALLPAILDRAFAGAL